MKKQIPGWILAAVTAGILILAIGSLFLLRLLTPEGAVVSVTVEGEPYGSYPLNEDRDILIQPAGGSWHNLLQIRDGTASVTESDCSNQICVYTPAMSKDNSFPIVCLPHGVVVELVEG